MRTYRVRIVGPDPGAGPLVFAFFHGRQLGLFRYDRRPGMAVLSSLSRDGRLQASILRRLGFTVVDGSSSRGGARALAGIVRCVRRGLDAAFAVDGPRGPYGEPKPGVLAIARTTGARIVPITVAARAAWVLERAWDRYLIPRPFARVVILRGEPLTLDSAAGAEELEQARAGLGASLHALTSAAEEMCR